MRKIIVLCLLITYSFSSNNNYEQKLYEKILPAIYQKEKIIYFTNSKSKSVLQNSNILISSLSCEDADIIIGKKFDNLPINCRNKPIFGTSYRSFLNFDNSIGAFYWRKGRPQIKFKLATLKKYNLELPKSLMEFAQ